MRAASPRLVTALVAGALGLAILAAMPAGAAVGRRQAAKTLCSAPDGTRVGVAQSPALVEISGAAWSRQPDLLWAHNDSGDAARVFALGLDGRDRGIVSLAGVAAVDWEDLALQRGDARRGILWVGDIGDNAAARTDITVHRFAEPPPPGPGATTTVAAESITLRYEDAAHDAEALLVDERTGDLVVVTKEAQEPAGVYRARAGKLLPGAVVTLRRSGDLNLAPARSAADAIGRLGVFGALASRVTAADASSAGKLAVVRSYGGVSVYAWPEGRSLAKALTGRACAAPAPADTTHPQGEAIALAPEGRAYVTVSEGANAPLVEVRAIRG